MKKYFAQLRPMERRLVIGVAVMVVIALNWILVWPHFSDYGNSRDRFDSATAKLKKYQAAIAQKPVLEKKVKTYESEGEFVALEDQTIDLMRTIQAQAASSGFGIQSFSRTSVSTNQFFTEQVQNIIVVVQEPNLVDFLYKLGTGSSQIRVRNLTLQPDPPRQRLSADIQLVASYQKSPKTSASPPATAKAK